MKFFICVIGMVMIIEGIPYFIFPDKMKNWMEKMLEMPPATLRIVGFFLMLTGLGFVYWGKG